MPSLQKNHNREVRASGEYITRNRTWLVITFLLLLVIGVIASEVLTRGKITPYFDGGWLTYLVHVITESIKAVINTIKEAGQSLKVSLKV